MNMIVPVKGVLRRHRRGVQSPLVIGTRRVTAPILATIPQQFSGNEVALLNVPSGTGDQMLLDVSVVPGDGGSPLLTLRWVEDTGSGFGAVKELPWTGIGPYPITVSVSTTATTIKVWDANAINGFETAAPPGALTLGPVTPTSNAGIPAVNVAGTITGGSTAAVGVALGGGTVTTFTGSPTPAVSSPWYRVNPSTGVETFLPGVTGLTPTPSAADNGFILRRKDVANNTQGTAFQNVDTAIVGYAAPFASVNVDGALATWSGTPPTIDPVGNPLNYSVIRPGYDALGNAMNHRDLNTVTARVRQPYPTSTLGSGVASASTVSLSEMIHATDTLIGAVNNSTRVAPLPILHWLTPDLEIVKTATYTVWIAAAHWFSRNGMPLASISVTATDGTHSVTVVANTLSKYVCPATGLTIPAYKFVIPLATLDQSALCTMDATALPWVGIPFTISTHADNYTAAGLANLSVHKFLCDKNGTYGTAYACVNAATGTAGGVTSTVAATAQATPFQTIAQAAAGIKTYNNTNFSRNNTSGGEILIDAGDYTHATFSASQVDTTTMIPLKIRASNPANKATTRILTPASSLTSSVPASMRWQDLTFVQNSLTITFTCFDSARANQTYFGLHVLTDCVMDPNGKGAHTNWFQDIGRLWLFGLTGVGGIEALGGIALNSGTATLTKAVVPIGCFGRVFDTATYHGFGNKSSNAKASAPDSTTANAAGVGTFFGWNYMCNATSANQQITFGASGVPVGARGAAAVGNIVEYFGTGTSANAQIYCSGDNSTAAIQNVLLHGNTLIGGRMNIGYSVSGSTVAKSCSLKHNVFYERNTKTDIFVTDAAAITNWPLVYGVGWTLNTIYYGGSDGSTYGVGRWLGESRPIGETNGSNASPLDCKFTLDAGLHGTQAGYGDYTPMLTSPLPKIPAGKTMYAWDALGRDNATDGTAWIGARQADTPVPATMVIGDWTLIDNPSANGDTATLGVVTAPADNGRPLTLYEYTTDNGTTALTLPNGLALVGRDIAVAPNPASTSVKLRARNLNGPGLWSDTKTVSPTKTVNTFKAADFSVVDLQDGTQGVIVIHRTPGPMDGVARGWQMRMDENNGTILDLPFPIEPTTFKFTGTAGNHTMQLRVIDDNLSTGAANPRPWGAAVPFSLVETVVAKNMLDFSNNIALTDGTTQGTGTGQVRIGWNYAGTSNNAGANGIKDLAEVSALGGVWYNAYGTDVRQELNAVAEKSAQHNLFTASVRRRALGASATTTKFTFSGVLGYSFTAAVTVNWGTSGSPNANPTITTVSTGTTNFSAGWITQPSSGNGWVGRLWMAWTMPTASGSLRTMLKIAGGGSSYATGQDVGDLELRAWTVGDTTWVAPTYTIAASQAILSQMPTASNFTVPELQEQSTGYPSGLAGTVFPNEVGIGGGNPLRYGHAIGARVTAGGSGYSPEGQSQVSMTGGGGGTGGQFTLEVLSGAIVGIYTNGQGSNYTSAPAPDLTALGGTGATFAITQGYSFTEKGLSTASVAAAGSGYVPGTYVIAASGGAGSDTSGKVKVTVGAGGTITGVSVIQRGIYTSAPTITVPALGGSGTGGAITLGAIATWQTARPSRWPTLAANGGWNGNAAGSANCPVEGFVAFGQFWAAGAGTYLMPDGTKRGVTAAGVWTVDPNGVTTGWHSLQRVGQFEGMVLSNGARRSVIGMPIFLTGDQTPPLQFIAAPFLSGSDRLGEALVAWHGDVTMGASGTTGVTVEYQWRKNQVPISGAVSQQSPRFAPGSYIVGDLIDCKITLLQGGSPVELYTTTPRTLRAMKIDALAGSPLTYGRATANLTGHIPIGDTGTTISTGNAFGDWQVVNDGGVAYLTPAVNVYATAAGTLGNGALASNYALTFSNGKSLNLTTVARDMTMSRYSDMVRILGQRTSSSGIAGALEMNVSGGTTIRARQTGDWGLMADQTQNATSPHIRAIRAVGGTDGLTTSRVYIQAEDAADRPEFGITNFDRTTNVEIANIDFTGSGHWNPNKGGSAGNGQPWMYLLDLANCAAGMTLTDTAVRGPLLLRERGRLETRTSGIQIGSPVSGDGGGNKLTCNKIYIGDVLSAFTGPGVNITINDFRIERLGHDMMTLSEGALLGNGAIFRRGVIETVMTSIPEAHPDYIQITLQNSVGTPPADTQLTLDQVMMVPGRSGDLLSQGLFSKTLNSPLPRYRTALTITKSLICTGNLRSISPFSPGTGLIEDVTVVRDLRTTAAQSPGEPSIIFDYQTYIAGQMVLNRCVAGGYAGMGSSVIDPTVKTVSKTNYAANFAGTTFVALRAEDALAQWKPTTSGPLDLGGGLTAGAVNLDGSFKGDLSNLPARRKPRWGTPSWTDLQTTNYDWGALATVRPDL